MSHESGSRAWLAEIMVRVFERCHQLRGAGQQEYARRDENAFANFERVAERLKIPREKVLLVYLEKHMDGIHAWTDGHRSQREDVRGRILDGIVYLSLFYGMVEQEAERKERPVESLRAEAAETMANGRILAATVIREVTVAPAPGAQQLARLDAYKESLERPTRRCAIHPEPLAGCALCAAAKVGSDAT